ncbi:MAG: hypothetical protein SOV85_16670 [Clostridium sp.]|nr:hypothetical protein [Clostridium sp.]MDY2632948.1 hypothetical protein [Clostridium sp.]
MVYVLVSPIAKVIFSSKVIILLVIEKSVLSFTFLTSSPAGTISVTFTPKSGTSLSIALLTVTVYMISSPIVADVLFTSFDIP